METASQSGEQNISPWKTLKNLMIQEVPSYGNKIFYSLGFLSLTSFVIVSLSGLVMVFFGPNWWLTTRAGLIFRSIHLWAAQAFIFFVILHGIVVFLTSGFKGRRKLTWVLGIILFFLILFEAEFGYGLRGDFSSQWRTLQGADLFNGSGLGIFINNLNYAQIYGIHIILIPFLIFAVLSLHYFLVRVMGIAKPYRSDAKYRMVPANHNILFMRGFVLTAVIIALALAFPSPLIIPTTIKTVADSDPQLMATTLLSEMNRTSGTATYLDNIDPYTYDTRSIYITDPYDQYAQIAGGSNLMTSFNQEPAGRQNQEMSQALSYFSGGGVINTDPTQTNPVVPIVSSLVVMAKSGLYQNSLQGASSNGLNGTYVERFLSDTGVLEAKAEKLNMTTEQYGMVREETGLLPPGAWWLAPIGFLDNTILANDPNQDRDGAEILGLVFLFLLTFPYIPYLNRIPEKIGIDKLIWK
jgi:ubiquinol-cytochrome c reductase cytochrome b subunit